MTTLLFDGGPWDGQKLYVEGRPDSWVVKVASQEGLSSAAAVIITDVVYVRRDAMADVVLDAMMDGVGIDERPIVMIPEGRRRRAGISDDPRRN